MAQAPDLFSFVFTTEELQDILPAKAFVTEEAAEVSQHSPAGRWHVGKWVTQTDHQEWVTFRIKQLSDGRAALTGCKHLLYTSLPPEEQKAGLLYFLAC